MQVQFSAKWLQIIAQGFSPRNGPPTFYALNGRPTRARLDHIESAFVDGGLGGLVDRFLATASVGLHFRPPFQVGSGPDASPGLDSWAILLDHFMVKAGCVALMERRSRMPRHARVRKIRICKPLRRWK
jgi:hypothetical protein